MSTETTRSAWFIRAGIAEIADVVQVHIREFTQSRGIARPDRGLDDVEVDG